MSNNEIKRFVNACASGSLELVKEYYDKYGKSIVGFKRAGVQDYKSPYFYALRNGHIEVAKYLKSLDPQHINNNLSKLDIYNIFMDTLSGSGTRPALYKKGRKSKERFHERCTSFIIDGLDLFDTETVILAAVDATLRRLDVDMYCTLVDEFNVSPQTFILRMNDVTINSSPNYMEKHKKFMREVKLKSLLDD